MFFFPNSNQWRNFHTKRDLEWWISTFIGNWTHTKINEERIEPLFIFLFSDYFVEYIFWILEFLTTQSCYYPSLSLLIWLEVIDAGHAVVILIHPWANLFIFLTTQCSFQSIILTIKNIWVFRLLRIPECRLGLRKTRLAP